MVTEKEMAKIIESAYKEEEMDKEYSEAGKQILILIAKYKNAISLGRKLCSLIDALDKCRLSELENLIERLAKAKKDFMDAELEVYEFQEKMKK